jgi:hypothetical protein
MPLDDPEGLICRWCNEGTYKIFPNEHLRVSEAGDDVIKCDACGEPPMTFEEVQAEIAKSQPEK